MPTGPDPRALINEDAFLDYVSEGQTYSTQGGPRSTAAINGTQQYAATTHSISDILQGNLYQSNPQDQLLVINKALTDNLSNVYTSAGDAYAYSSFTQAVPSGSLIGGGTGAGANQGEGSQLNESWVNSLPLTHPTTNAVIWTGEGKGSREMHLPTSEDINTDVSQHKQVDMPDEWKHPYNMDRSVGDGAGGNKPHIGSDGYVHDWGGGENIISSNHPKETIGNENPQAPGTTGAFGYLDPDSEQWYMAMAWPYKSVVSNFQRANRPEIAVKAAVLSQSDYKGKKLLVFHPASGRGVVCTPGDWGSQPYWSNGADPRGSISGFYYGLSPDVHASLGTDHGDNFKVRWMPDDTPLGPYAAQNTAEGSMGGGGSAVGLVAPGGSSLVDSIDDIKYAGNIIANHPNLYFDDSFKESIRNGNSPQTGWRQNLTPVFDTQTSRIFYYPSLLNFIYYVLEAGFTLSSNGRGYVHKSISDGSRLSNHAHGGAWDIFGVGVNGNAPAGFSSPQWRGNCEALWNFLASKPRDLKPTEVGGDPAGTFGGWFRVYYDQAHVHFGFGRDKVGQLIPELKGATNA